MLNFPKINWKSKKTVLIFLLFLTILTLSITLPLTLMHPKTPNNPPKHSFNYSGNVSKEENITPFRIKLTDRKKLSLSDKEIHNQWLTIEPSAFNKQLIILFHGKNNIKITLKALWFKNTYNIYFIQLTDNPKKIKDPDQPKEPDKPKYTLPDNWSEITDNNLRLKIYNGWTGWWFTWIDTPNKDEKWISTEKWARDKDALKSRHKTLKNFWNFKIEIIDPEHQNPFTQNFTQFTYWYHKSNPSEIVPITWKLKDDKDKKTPPPTYNFRATFDDIPMVHTNWSNMWLIDTIPFFMRFQLVKQYENNFGFSPNLRNFLLGKPTDETPNYAIYTDRFLAPVPFEALSFLFMDVLTDGVGVIARTIFTKLVAKFRYFKAIEKGLLHAQASIAAKLERLAQVIGEKAHQLKEFSLWIWQEERRLKNLNTQINNTNQLLQNALQHNPSWNVIKPLRKQLNQFHQQKLTSLNYIQTLSSLFDRELPKLLKNEGIEAKLIAEFQAINQTIISNATYITNALKSKSYLLGAKLYKFWRTFQTWIPKLTTYLTQNLSKIISKLISPIKALIHSYTFQNILLKILNHDLVFYIIENITKGLTKLTSLFTQFINKIISTFSFAFKTTGNFLTNLLPIISTPFINNIYSSQSLLF